MDSKTLTKTICRAAGVIAFAGLVAVGCGDDDNGVDPVDAGNGNGNGIGNGNGNGNDIDAGPIAADACVPGHGVQCEGVHPLEMVEGAKFRIEVLETAPNGTDGINATDVHLWHNQDPPRRDFLGGGQPAWGFEDEANGDVVGCFDLREGAQWDGGSTPENQAVVDTRDYFDVGDEVTLSPVGGGEDRVLAPNEDAQTNDGVQHGLVYLDPNDDLSDDYADLELNTNYTVDIPGSIDFPVFTPSNGYQMTAESPWEGDFFIHLPSRFDFADSDFEDDYFAGPVDFGDRANAEPFTFEIELEEADAEDMAVLNFVAFINPDHGGTDIACMNFVPGSDRITVPAEVIEEIDPDGGALEVGRVSHFAWIHDERQVHNLGITCKLGEYTSSDSTD